MRRASLVPYLFVLLAGLAGIGVGSAAGPRDDFQGRIAFEVYSGTTGWLEVRDVATGSVKRLTKPVAGTGGRHDWLSWSPDGQALAFIRPDRRGHPGVYIFEIATGRLANTTAAIPPRGSSCSLGGPSYANLAWSPDGLGLAFARAVKGSGSGIYVVNRSGGGARLLRGLSACDASGGAWGADPPAWSADSTRIAFVQPRFDGDNCHNKPRVVVVTVADGQTTVIPTLAALPPGRDYGYAVGGVAWQPNGTRLLYVSNSESYSESDGGCDGGDNEATAIYSAAPPQTTSTRLAEDSGTLFKALWSPTGASIGFDNFTKRTLSVMSASGRNRRALRTGVSSDWDWAWARDGRALIEATPTGVRLRDIATGRIRELGRWKAPGSDFGTIDAVGTSAVAVSALSDARTLRVVVAPLAGGASRTIVVKPRSARTRIGTYAVTLP